jgi:hypothetical protein
MQTIKQKTAAPAGPAKTRWHGNRAGSFGITRREYVALGKFSNAAEKLGLETTNISKGPFGRGCLLKMSSGNHDYEVLVDRTGHALLGRVEKNGKRVKLCEGGTNTEAQWSALLQTLKNSEGRLLSHPKRRQQLTPPSNLDEMIQTLGLAPKVGVPAFGRPETCSPYLQVHALQEAEEDPVSAISNSS